MASEHRSTRGKSRLYTFGKSPERLGPYASIVQAVWSRVVGDLHPLGAPAEPEEIIPDKCSASLAPMRSPE